MEADLARPTHTPPIINAPPMVAGLAVLLVAAHAVRALAGPDLSMQALMAGALQPDRFWAWAGLGAADAVPYGSPFAALVPLVSEALLHDGWAGAILNAALVVLAGRPVYRALYWGKGGASGQFLVLFIVSVLGGSVAHLVSHYPSGPALMGASGGVSGLLGALVIREEGRDGRVLSQRFGFLLLVFAAVNVALALAGPAVLGAEISWQAHIGGFLAGAIAFVLLRPERKSPRF